MTLLPWHSRILRNIPQSRKDRVYTIAISIKSYQNWYKSNEGEGSFASVVFLPIPFIQVLKCYFCQCYKCVIDQSYQIECYRMWSCKSLCQWKVPLFSCILLPQSCFGCLKMIIACLQNRTCCHQLWCMLRRKLCK